MIFISILISLVTLFTLLISDVSFPYQMLLIAFSLVTCSVFVSIRDKNIEFHLVVPFFLLIVYFRFLPLVDRFINNNNHDIADVLITSRIENFYLTDETFWPHLISVILTMMFLFGLNFGLSLKVSQPRPASTQLYNTKLKLIIFLLLSIYLLYSKAFITLFAGSRWSDPENFTIMFMIAKPVLILFSYFLLYEFRKSYSKTHKVLIMSLAVGLISLCFMSGSRTYLVYLVFPIFLYFFYTASYIGRTFLSLTTLALPGLLVLVDVIRSKRSYTLIVEWLGQFFADFSLQKLFLIFRPILEYQAHLEFDIQYVLAKGYALNDYMFYSFNKIFLMPFPRSILPNKPISYSEKFCSIVNPDIENMSCGTGMIGEVLFNFGDFSFIAAFALGMGMGAIIKYLNNLVLSNRDRYLPLSFALVPLLLDTYRSPYSDSLINFAAFFIIYKIAEKRFIIS